MVHVVPCHHFVSQDVFVSQQEPIAFCCAQGKGLIATSEHVINVHNLDSQGSILHSFSTVDKVEQMIYCDVGNYVAVLERRSLVLGKSVTHVRIYLNWWIEAKTQPLKIRIAGSSSLPRSQSSSDQFELVELPLTDSALCIGCCKTTAVLGVSLGRVISVFCYSSKASFGSPQKQHNFNHFIDVELKLTVEELSICEGYFSCMSKNQVQVFKVTIEKEDCSHANGKANARGKTTKESNEGNKENLGEHYIEWRFESCTLDGYADTEWEESLRLHLHPDSFPITINLPATEKENQKGDFPPQNCEVLGPVLTVLGFKSKVKLNTKAFEIWPGLSSANINVVTLLFRQFEFSEEQSKLMSLYLIPLYESDSFNKLDPLHAAAAMASENSFSLPSSPLLSYSRSRLKAIGCFFSTHQEGFLYDVTREIKLVSSYSYTSTLKCAVLDSLFLHALTDAGLETYTSHLLHCAIENSEDLDGVKNNCPNFNSPVCLLGLRPFLGVNRLVMAENYLILVSSFEDIESNTESSENSGSTLYVLKKPTAQQVFTDMLEMGQMYKTSSPSTYLLVLSEGHVILRTHLFLCQNREPEVEALYRKSCILLGDYYSCSSNESDKQLAVPYYYLSKLSVEEVVQRLLGFQNQFKNCSVNSALVQYLNLVLLDDCQGKGDVISKAISESILDMYMVISPDYLWKVILCSGINTYRIEKAMLLLKRRLTNKRQLQTPGNNAADTLAIVSLLLKKNNPEAAKTMLLSITKNDLISLLIDIHKLFWSDEDLSQLKKFVCEVRPDALVEFLIQTIQKKILKMDEVIEFLQLKAGDAKPHKVPLLKEFLETLLRGYKTLFEVDSTCEISLASIYLNQLTDMQFKTPVMYGSSRKSPFPVGGRPTWLNEMPPFNGRTVSRNCTIEKESASENEKSNCKTCPCWICNESLIKLQCLLCRSKSSKELCEYVFTFLFSMTTPVQGHLSLEILCLSEEQAAGKLLQSCPIALYSYAVETFGKDQSKWGMFFPMLEKKVDGMCESNDGYKIYSETFKGVLNYLAEVLTVSSFLSLISDGDKTFYAPFVKRCCERHQAQQLKNKIVTLGNEIKAMM